MLSITRSRTNRMQMLHNSTGIGCCLFEVPLLLPWLHVLPTAATVARSSPPDAEEQKRALEWLGKLFYIIQRAGRDSPAPLSQPFLLAWVGAACCNSVSPGKKEHCQKWHPPLCLVPNLLPLTKCNSRSEFKNSASYQT